MLLIDPEEGVIVDANPAAARFYGWSRRQLRGMQISRINTLSPEEIRREMRAARERKREVFQFRHRRADGSVRDVEVYSGPVRTSRRVFLFSIIHDVTDRKRAEEALRRSEKRYRTLFEQSADGIYVHGLDGTILDVNREAQVQSGYAKEELVGANVFDFHAQPSDQERIKALWQDWEPGQSFYFEDEHVHEDGSIYPVGVETGKIRLGEEALMLAIVRDLTESRRMEAQLRQAQKMEAVGRLAGGVAHDFNNMLNVILGHAHLGLDDLPADHPVRDDLLEICAAAERSAELTRQLLAYARQQTARPRVLDLNEIVASLLRMLERLIGENIHLRWRPGDSVSPVRIDPTQVDQVLANLVVNARDAMEGTAGEIVIGTEEVEVDEEHAAGEAGLDPGRYVVLSVRDDGCGMDPEMANLIFEPFFTTKETGKGTGLGLSTVWGIAKQNDGAVRVSSKPGEGTTFRVYLPVSSPARGGEEGEEAGSGSRVRGHETVLLVEDEPAILKLGARMLDRLGYRLLTAPTPGDALALARDHPGAIDLLITDVVMPEMDGWELAERVGTLHSDLRCLFMSGYTADVIADHGVVEEGTNFLQKPFSFEVLGEKVREVLDSPT